MNETVRLHRGGPARRLQRPPGAQVQAYKDSRLDALLAEYESARTGGRWLDACTRAGQIAAAYRETSDPNAYAWDTRRQADCQIALEAIVPPPAD